MPRRVLKAMQVSSLEIFIAVLCLVSGLPILINPVLFAPVVLAALPMALIIAWAVALVLGGGLMLGGVVSRNVYILRAGLILVSAAAFVVGMLVLLISGYTRIFSVGVFFLFSWSLGARYWELGKVLKARRHRWKEIIRHNKEE